MNSAIKIEPGDTLVCIKEVSKYKTYMCSLKEVDLSIVISYVPYNYYFSKSLITEKKYIKEKKNQFAVNTNSKNSY